MFAQEKQKNLLVIDDNEAIHDDFRKIFANQAGNEALDELEAEIFGDSLHSKSKKWSYRLEFASQGKEGFELLRQAREEGRVFAAAFVDMRMPPGWDGVETIKNLWIFQKLRINVRTRLTIPTD